MTVRESLSWLLRGVRLVVHSRASEVLCVHRRVGDIAVGPIDRDQPANHTRRHLGTDRPGHPLEGGGQRPSPQPGRSLEDPDLLGGEYDSCHPETHDTARR